MPTDAPISITIAADTGLVAAELDKLSTQAKAAAEKVKAQADEAASKAEAAGKRASRAVTAVTEAVRHTGAETVKAAVVADKASQTFFQKFGATAKKLQTNALVSELETMGSIFITMGGNVSRLAMTFTSLVRPVSIFGTIAEENFQASTRAVALFNAAMASTRALAGLAAGAVGVLAVGVGYALYSSFSAAGKAAEESIGKVVEWKDSVIGAFAAVSNAPEAQAAIDRFNRFSEAVEVATAYEVALKVEAERVNARLTAQAERTASTAIAWEKFTNRVSEATQTVWGLIRGTRQLTAPTSAPSMDRWLVGVGTEALNAARATDEYTGKILDLDAAIDKVTTTPETKWTEFGPSPDVIADEMDRRKRDRQKRAADRAAELREEQRILESRTSTWESAQKQAEAASKAITDSILEANDPGQILALADQSATLTAEHYQKLLDGSAAFVAERDVALEAEQSALEESGRAMYEHVRAMRKQRMDDVITTINAVANLMGSIDAIFARTVDKYTEEANRSDELAQRYRDRADAATEAGAVTAESYEMLAGRYEASARREKLAANEAERTRRRLAVVTTLANAAAAFMATVVSLGGGPWAWAVAGINVATALTSLAPLLGEPLPFPAIGWKDGQPNRSGITAENVNDLDRDELDDALQEGVVSFSGSGQVGSRNRSSKGSTVTIDPKLSRLVIMSDTMFGKSKARSR
jgi:hypothetical protein